MSLLRASKLATRVSTQIRRNSQIASHENVDIVIVGGGPAGLALAAALGELIAQPLDTPKQFLMGEDLIGSSESIRESSLRVTLVEASDLSKIRDWAPREGTFSNRVSSLTNASQAFLQGTYTRVRVLADLVD